MSKRVTYCPQCEAGITEEQLVRGCPACGYSLLALTKEAPFDDCPPDHKHVTERELAELASGKLDGTPEFLDLMGRLDKCEGCLFEYGEVQQGAYNLRRWEKLGIEAPEHSLGISSKTQETLLRDAMKGGDA